MKREKLKRYANMALEHYRWTILILCTALLIGYSTYTYCYNKITDKKIAKEYRVTAGRLVKFNDRYWTNNNITYTYTVNGKTYTGRSGRGLLKTHFDIMKRRNYYVVYSPEDPNYARIITYYPIPKHIRKTVPEDGWDDFPQGHISERFMIRYGIYIDERFRDLKNLEVMFEPAILKWQSNFPYEIDYEYSGGIWN